MSKPKNEEQKVTLKWSVLKRMFGYLMRHKLMVLLALVLMILSSLLSLAGPKLSGNAIAAIEGGRGNVDFDKVFFNCGLMIIFYISSALLSYVLSCVMIRLSQMVSYTMRKELFDHISSLPVGFFDRNQTGDIISRFSYDVDVVNSSLAADLLQICSSAITIIGSFIMMFTISRKLIIIFIVTLPLSVWFTKYRAVKVKPLFRKRSAKLGELNGYAEEMLSGQKTIKAYNRENTIIGRFDQKNEEAVEAYYNAEYQGSVVGPSVNFINNLSLSLVSMLGALLYLSGDMSLANISSFILYSRRFSGPVGEIANIFSDLQSATSAAERIFRVLDENPEPEDNIGAEDIQNVLGDVELKNVYFGYSDDKIILHNLSLHALPGSTIAIVGPTGAGKTTIINLLMRFYDAQSGSILLDGKNIRNITRSSLRKSFTMVLQDTWLFNGTISENISFGSENVTDKDIKNAARAAMTDNFISSLPNGYNTVLSDDGVNISKGQKQLITIARAMLSDAPVLILDEATSNVDSRTEQQIQAAMDKLMEGRTSFVIAHRLSTIKNADLILVLKDGSIIEQGTHDELISANGFYSSLYNSQFDE